MRFCAGGDLAQRGPMPAADSSPCSPTPAVTPRPTRFGVLVRRSLPIPSRPPYANMAPARREEGRGGHGAGEADGDWVCPIGGQPLDLDKRTLLEELAHAWFREDGATDIVVAAVRMQQKGGSPCCRTDRCWEPS